MLVIVTGVPGSGKTTVSEKALAQLKKEGVEYELVTYGTVMYEIAREENLVENRDEMRKLPVDEQKNIQKRAAHTIRDKSQIDNILLDTHCSIRTSAGFLPGLPQEILKILNPDALILVEVTVEDIIQRRENDTSRIRDAEGVEDLMLHQQFNRIIGGAYSVIAGAPIKVIENPQGKIDAAVAKMGQVLKGE